MTPTFRFPSPVSFEVSILLVPSVPDPGPSFERLLLTAYGSLHFMGLMAHTSSVLHPAVAVTATVGSVTSWMINICRFLFHSRVVAVFFYTCQKKIADFDRFFFSVEGRRLARPPSFAYFRAAELLPPSTSLALFDDFSFSRF